LSLVLAGALALSFQTTPAALGYDLFQFGACEEAGWALDRTDIAPLVLGRLAESGLSDDDFQTALTDGATRAGAEFEATTVAIGTQAEARAFRDVTIERCNALSAAYPEILRRTPETEAVWNARMQGVIARYPE
jgi:hypothetical protein